MSGENGTNISLEFPVEVDGVEYTELFMRRPKVRDQLAAEKKKGTSANQEIFLFSNLCEVPPKLFKEMDMADYVRVQDAYSDFLPPKRKKAEEEEEGEEDTDD